MLHFRLFEVYTNVVHRLGRSDLSISGAEIKHQRAFFGLFPDRRVWKSPVNAFQPVRLPTVYSFKVWITKKNILFSYLKWDLLAGLALTDFHTLNPGAH